MAKFKFYAFKLTGIMIFVFILQVFISGFTDLFVLNGLAWQQWWRFVSAVFLHGGFGHLLFNGFALVLFGSILERLIGGRKFLTVFFVLGIGSIGFALSFTKYRPFFVILGVVLITFSIYRHIKKEHGVCNRKTVKENISFIITAIITAVVIWTLLIYVIAPLLARFVYG